MARDYSEYASAKREVAYAAITRYVTSDGGHPWAPQEWQGSAEAGFSSPATDVDIPGVGHGPTGSIDYTWTAGGGMDVVDLKQSVDPWKDWYEPWLTRVDDCFEGFDQLPEPSGFDEERGQFITAASKLTLSAGAESASPDDKDFGSSEMATSIAYINKWFGPNIDGASGDGQMGALVRTFDDLYGPTRMCVTFGNQRLALLCAGLNLYAESRLWEEAQISTMNVLEAAKQSLEFDDSGADLTIVKAFADLVSEFVPGGHAAKELVGHVAATVGFLDEVIPKPKGEAEKPMFSGDSADDIMTKVEEGVRKLKVSIFDNEEQIYLASDRMLDRLYDHAPDFHIHSEKGVDPTIAGADHNIVQVNKNIFREVGHRELPQIAGELAQASSAADAGSGGGPWIRPANLGYGAPYGAHGKWSEMVRVLTDTVSGSGRELVTVGNFLAAAAGFYENTDADGKAALKGLTAELDDGSLGLERPPAPPRGPRGWNPYAY